MQAQRVLKWEEYSPMQVATLLRHAQIWKENRLSEAQERWLNRQLNLSAERRRQAVQSVGKRGR